MRIKKNTLLFFLLILMSSSSYYAQDYVSISIHQDFKLLAFGDDLGNRAGTLDILTRFKYQFSQKKLGYLILMLNLERAEINNPYTRYGGSIGYTFNNFFSDDLNLEISSYLGAGSILREGVNTFSYSGGLEIGYKLSNTVKISSIIQFTDRTDLQRMFNDRALRYSFFFGLEINLFNTGGVSYR